MNIVIPNASARREGQPGAPTRLRTPARQGEARRHPPAGRRAPGSEASAEAELNQELIQKRQTLAEGHPEIIALKQTIDATRADPPQLAKLQGRGA